MTTNNLTNITDVNQLSKILPGLIASDLSSIPDSLKVSTVKNLIFASTNQSKNFYIIIFNNINYHLNRRYNVKLSG